jgi:glycosyltransferase involved in cell wall biosynthesis
MKISAVVTCYNCEAYVAEAIHSILNQTVKVHEIIVVNDGSTDKSLEILESFGDKIKVFTQENKGLCKSLNVGVRLSEGDYIAFLDSDDLWELDKIESQLIDLQNNPDYSVYAGAIRQFVSPEIENRSYSFNEFPKNSFAKTTCLIHKKVFLNGAWFKEENSLIDFLEWVELVKSNNEKIYFSPKIVALRRIRPNSMSQSKDYYPNLLKFLKNRIDTKRQNEQN